jgi:glycosyltransferase involved in cell wall biosynthesis
MPRSLVDALLPWGVQRFQRRIATAIEREPPEFVVGYEGSALTIFEAAARVGVPCVLDMAHPHPRASLHWMRKAHQQWPNWSASDDSPFLDRRSISRIDGEIELASAVLCASAFSASWAQPRGTLDKTGVVPYAMPTWNAARKARRRAGSRLRVLFLGTVGLRKGIPVLLSALDRVRTGSLTVVLVGRVMDRTPLAKLADERIRITGRLSNESVREELQNADVLVLPSYVEGFGLVLLEAMQAGVPFIASRNTAGPDLLGEDGPGWLVDAGDVEGLASTLDAALRADVDELGEAARHRAKDYFTWARYVEGVRSTIVKGVRRR